MISRTIRFAAVVLAAALSLAAPALAEEYVVNSYVVGGTPDQARQADQALIGMQHWYADQFGGRTFKFNPTKMLGPGGPRYLGANKVGYEQKGVINVFWDNGYARTTRPEGFGGGMNDGSGGGVALGVKGVLDPIIKNSQPTNPLGYGGAGRAWYVAMHEFGHALGMGHVGAAGTLMTYAGGPTEMHPFEKDRNQTVLGSTAKQMLAGNPFLDTKNNGGSTDPQAGDPVRGRGTVSTGTPPPLAPGNRPPANLVPTPPVSPPQSNVPTPPAASNADPNGFYRKPGQGGRDTSLMTGKERQAYLRGTGAGAATSQPTPTPPPSTTAPRPTENKPASTVASSPKKGEPGYRPLVGKDRMGTQALPPGWPLKTGPQAPKAPTKQRGN